MFLNKPENVLCRMCEKEGRITAAETIDHIKPPKGKPELFWDVRNWQPACLQCNAAKGAKE